MPTTHTVKQGECLLSIARHYGFADWQAIYQHADNEALRSKRPNPSVLYPGDEVAIPDREAKTESVGTKKTHTFRVAAPRAILRLVVREADDQPLADADYELHVRDAVRSGKTDGDGVMEEPIPPELDRARLVFAERGVELAIHFAHLDPVEEASGVQARLNNLGFWCGAVDGDIGPHTKAALASFQAAYGLDPTGEPTDETRERLRKEHDGD